MWIGLATALMVTAAVGVQVGLPVYRQHAAIREIEHFNGSVQFHPRGPEWLRRWIGEKPMKWVDNPWRVVFYPDEATLSRGKHFRGVLVWTSGPTINDAALTCLLGLPRLESLDLGYSNVTDAGVERLRHLQNLGSMCLEGTDVTDASIPILSTMGCLKRLNVVNTKITKAGGLALAAALPGCEVRGPHNDEWENQ
jgi:hypothetical protein